MNGRSSARRAFSVTSPIGTAEQVFELELDAEVAVLDVAGPSKETRMSTSLPLRAALRAVEPNRARLSDPVAGRQQGFALDQQFKGA